MLPSGNYFVIFLSDMFENIKIPSLLEKDSIKEAILDIRIEQQLQEKEIAKYIADFLGEDFSSTSIDTLPSNIRENDSQLRYVPAYKIRSDYLLIGIGLHNIFFDCVENYPGWVTLKQKIFEIIKQINVNKEYSKLNINKYILRYIDLFDEDIIKCCDVTFNLRSNLIEKAYSFSTKLEENNFNIFINLLSKKEKNTVVDVGLTKDVQDVQLNDLKQKLEKEIDECHILSKKYFFGLLKDDFIKTLVPKY